MNWFVIILPIFLLPRFVPPDNFNLALLTLELEFVKRTNRTEQVSFFHKIDIFFVLWCDDIIKFNMFSDSSHLISVCYNAFCFLLFKMLHEGCISDNNVGFAVRCCYSCSTDKKKIWWSGNFYSNVLIWSTIKHIALFDIAAKHSAGMRLDWCLSGFRYWVL